MNIRSSWFLVLAGSSVRFSNPFLVSDKFPSSYQMPYFSSQLLMSGCPFYHPWLSCVLHEALSFAFGTPVVSGCFQLKVTDFFFLITSSVIGGSKIYSELQHTIKNPGALVLFVLYHSHSFIDVYLQGYKTASIIFSSSERQCCSFSWVGRYLFVGKTISPELPRAFPLHLSGQPYTNITGKRHAITMIDLN